MFNPNYYLLTCKYLTSNCPSATDIHTQLISTNKPDLVLFVGEALVGNEAVDQLVKFNKAMVDFSNDVSPR